MELETALRQRRSIRAYRPDSVPRELIAGLLEAARWSPSWANTQCWQVYVVTGAALERLKEALRAAELGETPSRPDFRMPDRNWPEPLRSHSQALIQILGQLRSEGTGSMREFFGAPCLLLVAVDRSLAPDYACFDAGIFVQSLCLAAHDRGLGTCILAMAVRRPDVLREVLPQAGGMAFVAGISLGYPEAGAPINTFARPRAEAAEFTTWVE